MSRPPRLPLWLLARTLPPVRSEEVLGDLVEEWAERLGSRGRLRAHAWLWSQAALLVPRLHRLRDHGGRPVRREGDGMLAVLWNDVRFGARMLLKSPAFTFVSVLTLALGIGANTTIFSVVNALLVQPLPLPGSDRLMALSARSAQGRQVYFSLPAYRELAALQSFQGLSAFVPQSVNLTGRAEPTRVRGGFVGDSFFQVLQVQPALGRGFVPGQDDREGAARVCILQHETWRALFGADPSILGRPVVLNNQPYTVVGVMPAGFRFPFDETEVWLPFHEWPVYRTLMAQGTLESRANPLVAPIARLRDGVRREQAVAELQVAISSLAARFPDGVERAAEVRPIRDALVGDARLPLLVLLGAVALVLLIACANVANLMMARAATRQREWATRVALGAGRGRLIRQVLTETGLLWTLGGALGLLVGYGGLAVLFAAAPEELPGGLVARVDPTVLAYALGLTAVTAAVFGLAPALRYSRPDVMETLKEGGRSESSGGGTRLRSALVVSQVAMALVLLVGAGLLVRSLQALSCVEPGFASDNLLTMEYRLPANKYPEGAQQWEFHRQVVERVRALPGVRAATVLRALPFSGNGSTLSYDLPDQPSPADNLPRARFNSADPYSFATMGIPLLRGRVFDERDRADSPPVVVVSQRMVDAHWPGQDPIGRKVRVVGSPTVVAEVVGVVGDIKHFALDETSLPLVYAAQAQQPGIFNTLVVRTEGDPMAMAGTVRAALWSVDRDQPVWKIRTQASLIEGSTGFKRFISQVLTVYSALALLLAAVGIYGLMAYAVAQRTREIGVRMALGAHAHDVLRLMLRDGLKLTGLGVALGLPLAYLVSRLIRSLLFQTPAGDPLTFVSVALTLLAVAALASYLPARRATRVDPLVALRYD